MNREIKFRVWAKRWNKYFYPESIESITISTELIKIWHYKDNRLFDVQFHIYDIILEQYTGLKDSKGKEVYEGDIIGWDYYCQTEHIIEYSVVIWDEKNACFDFQDYNRPSFCSRKVIGNIRENKELLQGIEI